MSSVEVNYLGHSAFSIEYDGTKVLIDPFLTGNPKATADAAEVEADAILVTHGHSDHLGDAAAIASRTGAPIATIVETAAELADELGPEHVIHDPNLGGPVYFDWGWAQWVPAWHTSTTTHARDDQHSCRDRAQHWRQDDLPPWRHGTLQRSGASRPTPLDRLGVDPNWRSLHDGPP